MLFRSFAAASPKDELLWLIILDANLGRNLELFLEIAALRVVGVVRRRLVSLDASEVRQKSGRFLGEADLRAEPSA